MAPLRRSAQSVVDLFLDQRFAAAMETRRAYAQALPVDRGGLETAQADNNSGSRTERSQDQDEKTLPSRVHRRLGLIEAAPSGATELENDGASQLHF